MSRRCLIRGPIIGLLLLCLGGWAWSGFYRAAIHYQRQDRAISLGTRDGVVSIYLDRNYSPDNKMAPGWNFGLYRQPNARFTPPPDAAPNVLGFRVAHTTFAQSNAWVFIVPYWFFVVLFSLILCLMWRKSRPKPIGQAFPVEAKP